MSTQARGPVPGVPAHVVQHLADRGGQLLGHLVLEHHRVGRGDHLHVALGVALEDRAQVHLPLRHLVQGRRRDVR